MSVTTNFNALQRQLSPTKAVNLRSSTATTTPLKQLPAVPQGTVKKTAQMLSVMQQFAKEMGLDLLIAIRDQYSAEVTTLSSDTESFSLKEAARAKLVNKYSLVDETETKEAISAALSDRMTHLLESATTRSSDISEACSSSQLNELTPKPIGQRKLKHASEVNFATMMSLDDDDEVSEHENAPSVKEISSENVAGPKLRRYISEKHDSVECDLQLSHISSVDSARSAGQELEGQKFLSHTRWGCKKEQFSNPIERQGRNLFAQKHLFKSGLTAEKQSDFFDSDEEASFEADLSDPILPDSSNEQSGKSANGDEKLSLSSELSYQGHDDEDQLDFMFLACADWEKIVDDEQTATVEPKSADGARTVCFPASTQLKREVKADRKSTEASCMSFADYCKKSNDSEEEFSTPDNRTSLDIDSMMKVQSLKRSKKYVPSRKLSEPIAAVGSKRNSSTKVNQPLSAKRPGQFSSAATLFRRTAPAKAYN